MKPHIQLAHTFWKQLVHMDDTVVDATCGNGYDSHVLAKLGVGKLFCFDIQERAIVITKTRLEGYLERVTFVHGSHSTLKEALQGLQPKLIVYNLGYLPGGDKSLTTELASTIESLHSAIECIAPGGAISITCYPGHKEGKIEEAAVVRFCQDLAPKEWTVSSHSWLNRSNHPHLIFIQKSLLKKKNGYKITLPMCNTH